ncbi:MAG: penicillin-binding transpeptidase domain-containing protein [Planctomycetota bacterium]|nr:penicillin-binding transpeptidase domain-containing protein [Planctomycetota bacterium]
MSAELLDVRRFRMNAVFGILLLFFVVLLVRLGKIQLAEGARYAAAAEARHNGAYRFAATRGRILDRHGAVLAAPKPARRLGFDPTQITDARTFSIALSDHLGGELQPWQISQALRGAHAWAHDNDRPLPQYRVLVPRIEDSGLVSRLDELSGLSIRRKRASGVWGAVVHPEEGRQYPNGDYAAHVLGQMPRGEGQAGTGVEHALDGALTGREREVTLRRDGKRRGYAKPTGDAGSSTAGRDIALTIDITIQHFLERALNEMVLEFEPRQAVGLVLDPHSGDILAMACRPTFDPNHSPANANLAIQGLYEPGSFMKPFTAAWALGHGVVKPDEILDMPPSVMLQSETSPIRDSHEVGPGTVRKLIGHSSNTGAAELADRLGPESMRALFERLFPDRQGGTLCGLPYEQRGGPREATWPWWRAHRVAYGQGVHVTPLQMVTAFAAFAREDGCIPQPRILLDDDRPASTGVAACRREDLAVVRAGLEACVSEGTAVRVFADAPFTAAAKTATAEQKATEQGVAVTYENCSLTAYAPAQNPQVVVLVLAQVPAASGVSGGRIAGRATRRVLENVLAYWGVLPAADAALLEGEVR